MRKEDFHSFTVIRKDLPQEVGGLYFHLPKEYLEKISETNETLKRIEILLETIVQPKAPTAVVAEIVPARVMTSTPKETPSEVVEAPYLSLKLANSPDFYKVSKTFINDIENGKKSFGFQRMTPDQSESFISIFASFISYSKNNMPVLIIVEDFDRPEWSKIKNNFSIGSIHNCRCYDWGNVCLIDKKQILKIDNTDYQNLFETMKNDFQAIFWSISPKGIQQDYGAFSFFAMESVDSVTLVTPKGKAKISEVVKIKSFYSGYKIPIKGLLYGE